MFKFEPYTLDLSDVIRLSDDDLFKLCAANPDLRIERNAAGQLEITVSTGFLSDARAMKIAIELGNWNGVHGEPGLVLGGTAGFFLPNRAMRVPDAAWISLNTWKAISAAELEKFVHLVPEFVVEVRSASDRLPALQSKMKEWIQNGCRLGWMIDPVQKEAGIYRADGSIETVSFESILSGEDTLPGFEFDLNTLP